jgi:hypothetical protein
MLEGLSYFWGLFDSEETASVEGAEKCISFESSAVPEPVVESFEAERIVDLEGEFGLPGAGDPTEVDHLEYSIGGETTQVRVVNRGIAMFVAETPELVRLHRFFCLLKKQLEK